MKLLKAVRNTKTLTLTLFLLFLTAISACDGSSEGESTFNRVGVVSLHDTQFQSDFSLDQSRPATRMYNFTADFRQIDTPANEQSLRSRLFAATYMQEDQCMAREDLTVARQTLGNWVALGDHLSAGDPIFLDSTISGAINQIEFNEPTGTYVTHQGVTSNQNFPANANFGVQITGDAFPALSLPLNPELNMAAVSVVPTSSSFIGPGESIRWSTTDQQSMIVAKFSNALTNELTTEVICRLKNDGLFTLTTDIQSILNKYQIAADFTRVKIEKSLFKTVAVGNALLFIERKSSAVVEL